MERLDVLVERQILAVQLGRGFLRGVADRHQEMRLAEAGAAVNKEGVVRRARALGHRVTRGDGEPVRRAHHEGVEGVLGVERAGHAAVPAASFLSTSSEIPLSVSNTRSEEHTSELQSLAYLVCRLLLEKKKKNKIELLLFYI